MTSKMRKTAALAAAAVIVSMPVSAQEPSRSDWTVTPYVGYVHSPPGDRAGIGGLLAGAHGSLRWGQFAWIVLDAVAARVNDGPYTQFSTGMSYRPREMLIISVLAGVSRFDFDQRLTTIRLAVPIIPSRTGLVLIGGAELHWRTSERKRAYRVAIGLPIRW